MNFYFNLNAIFPLIGWLPLSILLIDATLLAGKENGSLPKQDTNPII